MKKLFFAFLLLPALARAECPKNPNMQSEFARSLILAGRGNVVEQRNVAVGYEVGYQVGKCYKDAYYWYSKAAKNGDRIAIDWMLHEEALIALHDGVEFMRVEKEAVYVSVAVPVAPEKVKVNDYALKTNEYAQRLYMMGVTGQ